MAQPTYPLDGFEICRCRSCGSLIAMVPTEASEGRKTMPVEVDENEGGNVVVSNGFAYASATASVAAGRFPGEPRFYSHFARCPDAGRWRR